MRHAVRQSNAIGTHQIRDLGISRHWVHDNVRSGLLTRVEPGVHVVGLDVGSLPRATCAWIGILRCGGDGALALETAAERHELWTRGPDDVHVATTRRSSDVLRGLAPDVVLHTHRVRELAGSDVVMVDGVPVTSVLRTICDLGRVITQLQLAHVIWNALYAEVVTLQEIRDRLGATPRRRGNATVRGALALIEVGSCGTKSRSEDEFVRIVDRHGFPLPLVNVLDAVGIPGVRLDFVWPELRVVFELDGRHHAMPGIKASDRAVTRALRRAGWTVHRLHYSRVWNDPIRVVETLDRVIGSR